jgi:hypothetical protein
MQKLVLQIIIRQWDKSQLSEQYKKAREDLPDRYSINSSAFALSDGRILCDQHGDDLLGNRVRYQLIDNALLIDRFRIDLDSQTVEFKTRLQVDEPPIMLTTIKDGWIQCQYQWRYRVKEGGFIYWLYENVIVNVCFINEMDATVFMRTSPQQRFENLLEIH